MSNAINSIIPRRSQAGIWLFDDLYRDLLNEPFVGAANDVIDLMVAMAGIEDPEDGFNLMFSDGPFPGEQLVLDLIETGEHGSTYKMGETEAWLCPALFRYYPEAPQQLHAAALPFRKARRPHEEARHHHLEEECFPEVPQVNQQQSKPTTIQRKVKE